MMNRSHWRSSVLALTLTSTAFAQESTPKTPPISIEERQQAVQTLEAHIAQREKRLSEWHQEIVTLDARIEAQIAELVKTLSQVRDSQESGMKVSQLKKETIDGLKKALVAYQTKRREVREDVRTGDQVAIGDLAKFDQRIIKRVDQIVELTKSIPTQTDVKKYESNGTAYWNGYYYETTRISDEWKQNRNDAISSQKQRSETNKALEAGLERLDQRRSSLKDLLKNRKLTDTQKQLYQTELGQIDAYEDQIRAQLYAIASENGHKGRTIDSSQVNDLEDLIQDARQDIREDVSRLFRSYDQFAKGREYLENLKQKLEAQKSWLKTNSPAK